MDINYMSENIQLYDLSKAVKKTNYVEYEHVVSDSKADVEAILKGNAHVVDDQVYVDNDLLKLKGKMNITVCIKSVNGNVFSIQQILDINEKLDAYEAESDAMITSKCVVEKVDCRVINERKIGVKVRYTVFVDCNVEKSLDVISGLEDAEDAEIMTEEVEMKKYAGNFGKDLDVSDTHLIPNDSPEVFEILYYDAVIKNQDCTVVEGGIAISGNVCFRLYYSYGERGESINYIENCVQFNELEELHDIRVDKLFCNIKVENFALDVQQDSDGEYRLINASAKVTATVMMFEEGSVQAATDLYGINKRLTPNVAREGYSYPVSNSSGMCQMTESVNLGPNIQVSEVLGLDAYCFVTGQGYDNNGTLNVTGTAPITIMYKDANGDIKSFSKDVPVNYDEKLSVTPDMMVIVSVEQVSAGYNLLSGNELDVRLNISLSFRVYGSDTFSYISDIQEDEYKEDNVHASLILHYCSNNDNVWGLSKKYHIRQDVLRQINHLEEDDEFEEGQQVIIPL